jgi:hypothetical protein
MKRSSSIFRRAGLTALVIASFGIAGCSDSDTVTNPNPNPNPGPINPGPGVESGEDNGLGSHGGEKRDAEQGRTDQGDPSLNQ